MDVIAAGDLTWPVQPPCDVENLDPDTWAQALAIAIDWIWALSGRKYGQWTVTFRPEWTVPIARAPRVYALGDITGLPPGIAATSKPLTSAPLPGPVASVSQVLIDNAVLATSAYEAIGNDLVRLDGGQWYRYQDVTQPTTAAGTWQITYLRGLSVPVAGQVAAGILACEEAKRLQGDKTCRLPNNTSNVARTGVTINLDALQLQKGFTGIREIDQWCRSVNPFGRTDSPQVWTPDLDPNYLPPIPGR